MNWELDRKVTWRRGVKDDISQGEWYLLPSEARRAWFFFRECLLSWMVYHLDISLGVRKEQHCDSIIPSFISWNCATEYIFLSSIVLFTDSFYQRQDEYTIVSPLLTTFKNKWFSF